MKILISLTFVIAIFCFGCKPGDKSPGDRPLVTVDGSSLTYFELEKAIPDNISQHDSIAIAEDYIGRWIRTKLMLRQAERNLSASEKDVEQLLEEYRTSLLVHLYQQKMLEQKHSPLVTSREIKDYYNGMVENFNLQENIIQGVFIKVPKDAPNQNQLRQWYRTINSENLVNLEAYSFQYARQYEQFIENWIPFSRVNLNLPDPIINEERFLRFSNLYETSDDSYNYYLAVHDYRLSGATAPLSFVNDRIRAILLNKKRADFLRQLGQDLYDEALRDKIVNFH